MVMKGMGEEATDNVLRKEPVTASRWLSRAAEQCDKVKKIS